jgi:glucosamine-6-phosphate deaminase
MEIIIQSTAEAATTVAARLIAQLLRKKPDAVLGLATGNTPLLLYRELIALKLDWRKVRTFNLDEYIGIAPQHPQSYHSFMWENFFKHVKVAKRNVHIPDGLTQDVPGFCRRYEDQIRSAGGIDMQVLGIGSEGHIGFNEPTSSLASRTRIKTLTWQTRKDNARFFGSERRVPHHVITMGIGTIMEARQCLLLAFGKKKARAVAGAIEGPITAMNPASALQMHPSTKVFLDEPASARLKKADYYRWVYENKPSWQKLLKN